MSGSAPEPPPLGLTHQEQRFLEAVRSYPGRNSSEYAKLSRMSGATALACRKSLITRGVLKAHRVATGARGRLAIVLEPVERPDVACSAHQGTP